MKIFFCDNRLGGLLGFRVDVVRHFVNQGHEVTLVAPKAVTSWDKVGLHDFKGYKLHEIDVDANGMNVFHEIKLFFQYLKLYIKERPDIVFNYTIKPNVYSSIAARICGCRVVCMLPGLGYIFDESGFRKKLLVGMCKFGVNRAERVLVLNQMNYDKLINEKIVDPSKLILLKGGEGVNLNYYTAGKADYSEGVTFLMVSRLLNAKGYGEFVSAARILSRSETAARFEILGPLAFDSPMGVRQDVFESDVESGTFRYLGVSNDVPSIVGRKDVVVVIPSWYKEGMNRSLMEACALGRPVITTDNPGCRELVVDSENGYIVPIKDADALADAMKRFLELPEDKKIKMAQRSREYIKERFDVEDVLSVYDAILNNNPV